MFLVEYRALIKRLNQICTRALESAAALAISRSHYEVSVEHFLLKLLDENTSDIQSIYRQLNVSTAPLLRALNRGLDQRQHGNSGKPVFSPLLVSWIQDAWLLGSVESQATRVRSGHLFAVLLLQPEHYEAAAYTDALANLDREGVRRRLGELAADSAEAIAAAPNAATPEPGDAAKSPGSPAGVVVTKGAVAEDSALGRYTHDLTARARSGQIDPVLGRDREIRQLIDILGRRQKNNPIIVGEAGVGKTALVEGLALRVSARDVPTALVDIELRTLDLGLLQAGAGVKGEFEARLTAVLSEVKASPKPIILFIDEAHTIIGAGNSAGGADAANLLKPVLARGEVRTIAATTWSEYKKYFEKDAALTRRFQIVKVEEPDREASLDMLRGLAVRLAASHGIHIRDDAVVAAVDLSRRYISGRLLPDKAVDLLDTCAARVKLGLSTRPAELEAAIRKVESLERKRTALLADLRLAGEATAHGNELAELAADLLCSKAQRDQLETRWSEEQQAAETVLQLRTQQAVAQATANRAAAAGQVPADHVLPPDLPGTARPALSLEREADDTTNDELLKRALHRLHGLQKPSPLLSVEVDPETVAMVVADWTGIPVGKMVRDDVEAVNQIEDRLMQRIRGQNAAISTIARRLRNARAGLQDPRQPLGVFLLVGPSGTGKTESALAISELLFGGERFMVTINMSEFQEKHTVSRLIGSPPGYVGYGEGGVLTEAVRQRPYSVVLMDEVEKADPEVLNLFYQVFDKGMLADGEGRVVDFRNTVILMTSNLGSDITMRMAAAGEHNPSYEDLAKALRPTLSRHFKPALLARMTVVPYFPISQEVLREIVELKLSHVVARLRESHRVKLTFAPSVTQAIVARCEESETGARNVDHIIREHLLPVLAAHVLHHLANGSMPEALHGEMNSEGHFSVAANAATTAQLA